MPVHWSSSASEVAIVRGDQLVADAAGRTVITATVEGVVGSVDVRVLALPSREEVGAMLQERFVDLLRRRDTGAVERILGQGGRAALQREIVQRMQEPNFGARMTRMGDVTPSGPGVAMEFDLRLSWRDGAGAQVQPPAASFQAMLEPTAAGWRIAGVNRLRR